MHVGPGIQRIAFCMQLCQSR